MESITENLIGKEFYCRAHLYDCDRRRVFTAGKTYKVVENWPQYEAIEFIDDRNTRHMVSHDWLQNFDRV